MVARALHLTVLLVVAAVLLAGCGGDDEGRVSQEGSGTSTTQSTATSPTTPETAPAETETTPTETETSPDAGAGLSDGHGAGHEGPEDSPGGAGDEIPASVPARLTGRGGDVTPRLVRVPPYIAIRVALRSADGGAYELRGGGETVRAGKAATFDGLRPGRRLVLTGRGGRVVIEASAEPGP